MTHFLRNNFNQERCFIYLFIFENYKRGQFTDLFTATYCVKAIKVGVLLVRSPKKKKKNFYELMDEIKFSHCITNELFRNTSLRIVDTMLDFTTMKLKSHS